MWTRGRGQEWGIGSGAEMRSSGGGGVHRGSRGAGVGAGEAGGHRWPSLSPPTGHASLETRCDQCSYDIFTSLDYKNDILTLVFSLVEPIRLVVHYRLWTPGVVHCCLWSTCPRIVHYLHVLMGCLCIQHTQYTMVL